MTDLPIAKSRPEVRDAATVVIVREDGPEPRILMGQRGAAAAFMPSKFVFPGGALDASDIALAPAVTLEPGEETLLAARPRPESPDMVAQALVLAAVRETWEETGLAIAGRREGPAPESDDPSWRSYHAAGFAPATRAMRLIFRAITPPGRPRRFDARFFLVPAAAIATPLDDFSRAEEELAHLSWLTLSQARALDLPFVTDVVLAELADRLAAPDTARPVPFFRHEGGHSFLHAL